MSINFDLIIKIDAIQLPRFLPSLLFVSWRCETLTGQTKLFRADCPLKQINESFEIPINKGSRITISLHAKSSNNQFRIGEKTVELPDSLITKRTHSERIVIPFEQQQFIIHTSFELIEHDQEIVDSSEFRDLIEKPHSIELYKHAVETIPLVLTLDQAKQYYSKSDGILFHLSELNQAKSDPQIANELPAVLFSLKEKATQLEKVTEIAKVSMAILARQLPLFFNSDLTGQLILTENEVRNQPDRAYPLISIYLSKVLSQIQNSDDIQIVQEFLINTIIVMESISVATSLFDVQWTLYMLSSALFLKQYIFNHHSPEQFSNALELLEETVKSSLVHLIEIFESWIFNQMRTFDEIKRKLNFLSELCKSFSVPDVVFRKLCEYICPLIDNSFSIQLANSGELSPPLTQKDYCLKFQNFEFPLISSVKNCIENIEPIFKRKMSSPINAEWLQLVLRKYAGDDEAKQKKIKTVVDKCKAHNPNPPSMCDHHEWASSNLKFGDVYSLPSNLQQIFNSLDDALNTVI